MSYISKKSPQPLILQGIAGVFLFKLNDCTLVSTISCASDFIKTTIFIRIIQGVFFYRRILGQNLVTLLCCNHIAFKTRCTSPDRINSVIFLSPLIVSGSPHRR